MTPEKMVESYLKLRDFEKNAKDEFDEKMKPVKDMKQKLEGLMLKHLHDTGAEHIGTGAGTVYRLTRTSASVTDREAFIQLVRETDNFDLLDLKANKTEVTQLLEAGHEVPGVKVTVMETVGVRSK